MITFNLKSSIALLTLGFLMGISLMFLFSGDCNEPEVKGEISISPKELKKQIESVEKEHQQKIADLEIKNQKLQGELATTKELLSKAKQKTKTKETEIKKLIQPKGFSARDLLAKVNATPLLDTSVSFCDSLINEVNEYILDNTTKDSLYEIQITQLDSTVVVKDLIISLKAQLNKELAFTLSQSIEQQEILLERNKQLQKKFKRQKFRRKVIAIGATILSGIAADYLIHR